MSENHRILVIDDDEQVTRVISEFLRRSGEYEVEAVNDPSAAVQVAKDFAPDLVVLDIIMPGMDGGELLAALHDVPELADVRAIFLTGLVTEAEVGVTGSYKAGHPIIAKPVRSEPFKNLVAEVLAR